MLRTRLWCRGLAALLLLSGCEAAQTTQRDFNRLVHGNPTTATTPAPTRTTPVRTAAANTTRQEAKPDETKTDTASQQAAAASPAAPAAPAISLTGKSEQQVRAMLGPPTSVEERTPGKTWHYRDGRCSIDVQLYPNVQTRQFATLAYEVKSDDNSDEGRRECLARLGSRAQPGSG